MACSRSTVASAGSIRGVRRLAALGPVSNLCRVVGTRLRGEVGRDVERVLVSEAIVLTERHARLDERSGSAQSSHAGPDVERPRTPECREEVLAVRPRAALP